MLEGQNIIVLDLETKASADDCRHCGYALEAHFHEPLQFPDYRPCPAAVAVSYERIGWENKLGLGLSIGCYFDYQDGGYHWFDTHTLEATMRLFVKRQPLLVSFNGVSFDFALMRAILRHRGENTGFIDLNPHEDADAQFLYDKGMRELCDTFKALCATSYDILRAIWQADPARKFERGLNSLGAISVANGFGEKEMDGAQAPRLWGQGRIAEVVQYCQGDVYKTCLLFEKILETGHILRGDALPIALPLPEVQRQAVLL